MRSKTDTWMPLYIGDYLADTQHLTTLEHGAYLLLLMAYWRVKGPLPDDDIKLARLARLTPSQWGKIKGNVAEFFVISDEKWTSNRAELELQSNRNRSERARSNALERWDSVGAKAKREQSDGNPDGVLRAGASYSQSQKKESDTSVSSPRQPARDECGLAFARYNETAAALGLPAALKLTPSRKAKLKTRLKEAGGLDGWNSALENLKMSAHCLGNNERGWRADFDFLLQPKSFIRLLEGSYGKAPAHGGLFDRPSLITIEGGKQRQETKIDLDWRTKVRVLVENNRKWDEDYMGPPPGDPGCLCPPHILAEFPRFQTARTA